MREHLRDVMFAAPTELAMRIRAAVERYNGGDALRATVKATQTNDAFSNQTVAVSNQLGISGGPIKANDENNGKPIPPSLPHEPP